MKEILLEFSFSLGSCAKPIEREQIEGKYMHIDITVGFLINENWVMWLVTHCVCFEIVRTSTAKTTTILPFSLDFTLI